MSIKETKYDAGSEKIVEIHVAGHPISLSFAEEPDITAAQRVRKCLIDSYIRQNMAGRKAP